MKKLVLQDSIKSPELAKRFSSNIPKTVDEDDERVDAYLSERPRDVHQRLTFPTSTRNDRDNRSSQRRDYKGNDYKNPYKVRDNFNGGRHRDYRAPYPQRDQANKAVPVLSLDSLIKCPKEILATETQLQLPAPRPVANPLRTGDPDKYCDYHQDKGHHTNDCIQLRKQLEIALESGKLNHLMKDLRQRVGRGQGRNPPLRPMKPTVEGYLVRRVYVDEGSSVEVMFEHCFENLPAKVRAELRETRTDLVGFAGEVATPLGGKIETGSSFGNEGLSIKISHKNFSRSAPPLPIQRNLGMTIVKALHAIPSTIHSMIKFPTPKGIATLATRATIIAECRLREEKQILTKKQPEIHEVGQPDEGADLTEQILVNPCFPDQIITIGGRLSPICKNQLKTLLINNMEVFAWEPSDMTGVPRKIIEHSLNVNPSLEPFCQKRRTFSPEKSKAVTNEGKSNQMAMRNEEKTSFFTQAKDIQHAIMKMPFGLKNAGATYQRLVDSTFQSQIGRNLEAYVDDMVIKSKDEKDLLADIAETFKNLKAINMKLNPKKCSFGVEEGKFLGYMVTSEGIRANPKKTKAISDLTSPKTLKEMQSSPGKASFAEEAFQQMKRLIISLPSLTPPFPKETLYAYLAVAKEAVSAVLLTDRNGRQCPVQYVSRTLNDAEKNYSPLEKLALSLVNMTRRLRRVRIARKMKVSGIEVKVDSKLVAKQINGTYEATKESMIKYLAKAKEFISEFKTFSIRTYIERKSEGGYFSKLATRIVLQPPHQRRFH
ncbi:reverse transcriptase domain-containing protein [Tanacetum coccineum]